MPVTSVTTDLILMVVPNVLTNVARFENGRNRVYWFESYEPLVWLSEYELD